jgi:tyrosyl-tRNA synthetase
MSTRSLGTYLNLSLTAAMLTRESGRDELDHLLTHKRVGVYCGVDPTAPSLHVGHMVPLMVLGWMYIHGYRSTFLVGQGPLLLPGCS